MCFLKRYQFSVLYPKSEPKCFGFRELSQSALFPWLPRAVICAATPHGVSPFTDKTLNLLAALCCRFNRAISLKQSSAKQNCPIVLLLDRKCDPHLNAKQWLNDDDETETVSIVVNSLQQC